MSSNQTPVNPQQTSYPPLHYERYLTNHSDKAAPFPTATPYNIWNSGMDWRDPEVPLMTGMDWYNPEVPLMTGMNSSNWNSETNHHYQSAPIQTGIPCSTSNSETNCHYHAASIPFVMPGSTSEPELVMQIIPWSEFQNSGAMRLFRIKMHCAAQTMSDQVNSLSGVNFGPNPATAALSVYDEFMMYCFKVEKCPTNRSHDRTDCPYLHTGEKARRRDPRKYLYHGKLSADFKKGQCKNGNKCHFAHGMFETWLHPDKYKTQMCRDRAKCQRKVCFFAHSENELRKGDGVKEDISSQFSPKSVLSTDQSLPESPSKFLNNDTVRGMEMINDTIRGMDSLQSNTAPNGFQNFANGSGYIVRAPVGRRNSNGSSEEIDFQDFPHIIWINAILDS